MGGCSRRKAKENVPPVRVECLTNGVCLDVPRCLLPLPPLLHGPEGYVPVKPRDVWCTTRLSAARASRIAPHAAPIDPIRSPRCTHALYLVLGQDVTG